MPHVLRNESGSEWHRGSTLGTMVYILIGPIVWALHFMVLYAGHSFTCGLASDGRTTPMPAAIVLAIWIVTFIALGALLAALLAPERMESQLNADTWSEPQRNFHRRTMSVLCLLSFVAINFAAVSTFFLDSCGLVR